MGTKNFLITLHYYSSSRGFYPHCSCTPPIAVYVKYLPSEEPSSSHLQQPWFLPRCTGASFITTNNQQHYSSVSRLNCPLPGDSVSRLNCPLTENITHLNVCQGEMYILPTGFRHSILDTCYTSSSWHHPLKRWCLLQRITTYTLQYRIYPYSPLPPYQSSITFPPITITLAYGGHGPTA